MSEFETIYYEPSPDGTRVAIVEQDDRVAYFYLQQTTGQESEGRPLVIDNESGNLQACWLRNLVPGPIAFQMEEMQQGIPPILPRLHCSQTDGMEPLSGDRVGILWFEEGNGAAVTYDGEIEAIIPPWSGSNGFHGYARHCTTPNQVCWPLPRDRSVLRRLDRARAFWMDWQDDNPWPDLQQYLLAKYRQTLDEHEAYYSIDGNHWPPKAIVRYQTDQSIVALTAGVCIRPQAFHDPDLIVPDELRRIEFGMEINDQTPESVIDAVLRLMSSIANYPWHSQQWIGYGHTYPFAEALSLPEDFELRESIDRFSRLVFTPIELMDFELPSLRYRDEAVSTMWLVPITQEESSLVEKAGAKALLKLLDAQGHTRWSIDRPSVV